MNAKINDWTNIYQNQLLSSFYTRRGKAIVIPHIINYLHRLVNINTKEPIRILDIGCGKGDLIFLLQSIIHNQKISRKIELFGLDVNQELISRMVDEGFPKENIFVKNIVSLKPNELPYKFDLIIIINTLHELLTKLLGFAHPTFPFDQYQRAQLKIIEVLKIVSGYLSNSGSLIIYDGLAPDNLLKKVRFRLIDQESQDLLKKISVENLIWKLSYSMLADGTYEMVNSDYVRFIATLKYIKSDLWKIEKNENYFYFCESEFEKAIEQIGLELESKILISNDLNYWQKHIKMIDPGSFPFKSILIMGSK
ncbi:MAG TPA: methyltransferase domain-containing protein [Candidatus Woesebacteria bacterium]|nr:methyltransferase domain-containing protein [Candidatus Woesebacteria bacterium]